jgi:hypothetical protein
LIPNWPFALLPLATSYAAAQLPGTNWYHCCQLLADWGAMTLLEPETRFVLAPVVAAAAAVLALAAELAALDMAPVAAVWAADGA